MPYTTLVAGTTITASWANASVRDQAIVPFASAAARDSAITAPIEGMIAYQSDVNWFTFYTGARWAHLPGTVIVRANRTTTSTTTTTEVGVVRTSIAVKSGQVYLIATSPLRLNSTVSGDYVFARVRYTTDGSTPGTSSTVLSTIIAGTGLSSSSVPFMAKYVAASDHTFAPILTCGRFAGTGTISLIGDATTPDIDLMVIALGTDPGDTGTDI